MAEFVFTLPDVGEGLAEAELVEWQVAVGDTVHEDNVICTVMTDKAAVEIPSPVTGKVLWLAGEIGDILAIGTELIRVETDQQVGASDPVPASLEQGLEKPEPATAIKAAVASSPAAPVAGTPAPDDPALTKPVTNPPVATRHVPNQVNGKPLAAPSVRLRAVEAGVDLRQVHGSGPAGRIEHDDLDQYIAAGGAAPAGGVANAPANTRVTEIKIIGLRRKIAEKMVIAKTRIPHITYVEEVEMTKLEELRETLNAARTEQQPRLTLLPFLVCAMVKAIAEHPGVNAIYDEEKETVYQHGGVHIGVATQTEGGLLVPVVRHAETLDVWAAAAEIKRLAQAARESSLGREELSGSTITISSLGALGGIVTTPVINHPEVAIVGINKMQVRPVWDGNQFVPQKMMNISASFDHRIIDGWDAATFVQKIVALLQTPAMIFMH